MIDRKEYLENLINFKEKKVIKVITGIRRCGKSTMFELYQDYLVSQGIEKERIVSINLEDGNYRMLRDPQRLYD